MHSKYGMEVCWQQTKNKKNSRILIGRLLSIYLYIGTVSSVTTGSETLHHKYRDDDQYSSLGKHRDT